MLKDLLEKLFQEQMFTDIIGAQVPGSKFIGIALHDLRERDNTAKKPLEIPSTFFLVIIKCVSMMVSISTHIYFPPP
jgi:hypothetical protein